jgi:hypothetical protein
LYQDPGYCGDGDPAKVRCHQFDKNSACEDTAVGIWDNISLRIEIIEQALTSKEGSFANILDRIRIMGQK